MTTRKFDHLRLGAGLVDNTDTSKRVNLSLSAIPTATTRTMIFPNDDTTLVGDDTAQTLTNKTITGSTNIVEANSLKTTGTAVTVSSAAPPSTGQVLTATSATAATWQAAPGALSVYLNQSGTTTLTSLSTLKQWYGRGSSSSSTLTFNVTVDGTSGGTPIFSDLTTAYKVLGSECSQSGSNGPVVNVQSINNGGRQVTVRIRRGNSGAILFGGTYQGLRDSTINCTVNLYIIGP